MLKGALQACLKKTRRETNIEEKRNRRGEAFKSSLKINSIRSFFVIFLIITSLSSVLSAKDSEASFEESLELRKIAEYWKEKDYKTAQTQIQNFLKKNPQSLYLDQLYAMLGDMYFQEKNFTEAATAYESIKGKEFRQKSQFQHLHSLYATGDYDSFISNCTLFLKYPNAKADEIHTIRFELAEIQLLKAHLSKNENEKKDLMRAALAEYQQLMETKYGELTLLPQAQIFAYIGEQEKAAALYVLLSQKDSIKREEYLFQAASLQLHFDRNLAIDTFGTIYECSGKNTSKAAFNQLNLLFQEKRYLDFIFAYEKALKHIAQDKVPLIQYYFGKSLFNTKNYTQAAEILLQSLHTKCLDKTQEKSTLLTLIACAKEMQDLTLFEKTLCILKAEFAHDEETANILLMHAQLCRDKKQWASARSNLSQLLELNPQHPQREAILYDTALLFVQEKKWCEGALAFESYLKEFPQSPHRMNALKQVLSCQLEDIKNTSLETQRVKKEQFLKMLNLALGEKKNFSATEKQKMRYLLGKTQYELGQYEESITTFDEYVQDFSKDPTCTDAYLLLAYAHQHGSRDDIHFVLNAEKALALNPQLQGAIDLHLNLFNTYLSLAAKALQEDKAEMVAKAADHLFLALDKPPNFDNQRWLASYYFQQYQNGKASTIERAILTLEKLLGMKENSLSLNIDAQTLQKEAEALKLAELYRVTGRLKERLVLLQALTKEQNAHSDLQWKYQRMAQFELGKTYLALAQEEHALNSFETLISSSSHVYSYFALAATIEKAKLEFSLLKDTDKFENSLAVQSICNALKEVQIKRKLHSEPLHLEAALCYIDIKTELTSPEKQKKSQLFLLEKMKESYWNKDDPLVQHYFSAAAQFPDKERLCQQYLAFVETEILIINAEENRNDLLLKESYEKLDKLAKETSDEALRQRIFKSREALGKTL